MKKSILPKTAERLAETHEGQALLAAITLSGGTPATLAAKLKVEPQAVRQWIYAGAIPKSAVVAAAKVLKVKPSALRPDLPASAWAVKIKEEKPAKKPTGRTEDAKLLAALAIKYGSVKAVCQAAHCTDSEFRTWKYRGRIPAIKLPTLLAL